MHGRRKNRATITDETSAQAGAGTIHRSSGETQGEWVAALPRKGDVRFGFVIMTRPATLLAKDLTEKAQGFPEAQKEQYCQRMALVLSAPTHNDHIFAPAKLSDRRPSVACRRQVGLPN